MRRVVLLAAILMFAFASLWAAPASPANNQAGQTGATSNQTAKKKHHRTRTKKSRRHHKKGTGANTGTPSGTNR